MGATITQLVFQPPDVSYMHAKKHIIWLVSRTGAKIPAFYIDRRSPITILFSHGNAEDLGMIYEWFCELTREIHVNLLAYDYEGYGKATGTPSEKACYEDIEAAYSFLTDILHQSSENIILYGRSLGSGPSCYLAEKLSNQKIKLGGLILQSPLMSIYRVAFNFRFTFYGDMFCNIDRDEVVPFWNGETMFLTCPVNLRAKPLWVSTAGHNNIESALREGGAFFEAMRDFLKLWVPAYTVHREGSGSVSSSSPRSRRYSGDSTVISTANLGSSEQHMYDISSSSSRRTNALASI